MPRDRKSFATSVGARPSLLQPSLRTSTAPSGGPALSSKASARTSPRAVRPGVTARGTPDGIGRLRSAKTRASRRAVSSRRSSSDRDDAPPGADAARTASSRGRPPVRSETVMLALVSSRTTARKASRSGRRCSRYGCSRRIATRTRAATRRSVSPQTERAPRAGCSERWRSPRRSSARRPQPRIMIHEIGVHRPLMAHAPGRGSTPRPRGGTSPAAPRCAGSDPADGGPRPP